VSRDLNARDAGEEDAGGAQSINSFAMSFASLAFKSSQLIVKVTLLVIPLAVALMIAVREVGTSTVRMVKVLLVVLAGMLMLLAVGAATAGLLLDKVTLMPLAGAAHSSVTVPVTGFGPTTGFGLKASDCTPMGRTLRAALLVVAPNCAVTLPVCVEATGMVVMVKVLVVAPAGTVTLAGRRVAARLSESVTTTPPAGAGVLSVTVPVKLLQPGTVEALSLIELKVGEADWDA
jgi:hypothetical protein